MTERELMLLGEYNSKVRETFDINEAKTDDQYFIMYGMKENEAFNPECVYGVWGASEVVDIMSYYRQTGILKVTRVGYHPRNENRWTYVQPLWVHAMQGINGMYRTTRFEQVQQPEDTQCCIDPNIQTFDNEVVKNTKVCVSCGKLHS